MPEGQQDGNGQRPFEPLNASTAPEEMLADGASPLWALCRKFVQRRVNFLVEKQGPELRFFALDDLVQEVFVHLHASLETYVASDRTARLTTYLATIVTNKIVDIRRKAGHMASVLQSPPLRQDEEDDQPEEDDAWAMTRITPERVYEAREGLRLIWMHLRRFSATQPQAQRVETILFAHFLQQEKACQIAERLGISLDFIYDVLARARKSLKADVNLIQFRAAWTPYAQGGLR